MSIDKREPSVSMARFLPSLEEKLVCCRRRREEGLGRPKDSMTSPSSIFSHSHRAKKVMTVEIPRDMTPFLGDREVVPAPKLQGTNGTLGFIVSGWLVSPPIPTRPTRLHKCRSGTERFKDRVRIFRHRPSQPHKCDVGILGARGDLRFRAHDTKWRQPRPRP
jgi:hypothetical protein